MQPIEGVYRLTGDVGQLAVPDSLPALLAARLDALDPGVRRLVADAAVLGTTFPAEALIAVSGQDEAVVRAALAELVCREVLAVSADRLTPADTAGGQPAAAALWEHAAEAAYISADWAAAVEQTGQAADAYRQCGDTRSAARAQVIAGQALRRWGRHAQAREQLTAAVAVLRKDPDADTVRALGELARLEVFAGSPAADALSAETLALGQAPGRGRGHPRPARSTLAGSATPSPGEGRRRPPTSGRPPGWPGRPATPPFWAARCSACPT